MTSIVTNQSAMVALETLRGINTRLEDLNAQISTGKKINTARDNAAVWAIATTMESDVMSFKTVTDSLNLGNSTLGVARNAAESITELLKETKALIASAQEENVDRAKIQTDIDNLEAQIGDIADAAQFNGLNLVKGGGFIELLSSFNRDSSGVTADKIRVDRVDLTIGQGTFGNGAALTSGVLTQSAGGSTVVSSATSTSADAISDGESETITFPAQIINTGDSFRVTIQRNGATADLQDSSAVDYEYVAREGDTANDVVLGLRQQLQGVAGLDITVQTSTNPSQNNVSLTITNQTGADYGAATVVTQNAQGTSTGSTGGLALLSGIDVTSDAAQALIDIEGLIDYAIDAAAKFGSSQKRVDIQTEFVVSLIDSLELGVGALTDADLSAASADLTALQVQQQLGLQSLAIANQAPQSVLALFR